MDSDLHPQTGLPRMSSKAYWDDVGYLAVRLIPMGLAAGAACYGLYHLAKSQGWI